MGTESSISCCGLVQKKLASQLPVPVSHTHDKEQNENQVSLPLGGGLSVRLSLPSKEKPQTTVCNQGHASLAHYIFFFSFGSEEFDTRSIQSRPQKQKA